MAGSSLIKVLAVLVICATIAAFLLTVSHRLVNGPEPVSSNMEYFNPLTDTLEISDRRFVKLYYDSSLVKAIRPSPCPHQGDANFIQKDNFLKFHYSLRVTSGFEGTRTLWVVTKTGWIPFQVRYRKYPGLDYFF